VVALTNVYVKNDSSGNGPLLVGIILVIVVVVALWWFLFSGNGGGSPAKTNAPEGPQITNPIPQGS
jgi:hypothetical protein